MHRHPSESDRPATNRRRWFLKLTAALVVVGLAVVQIPPDWERNTKSWLTMAIAVLGLVLGLIWFAFLSRFPWRVRLLVVAALGLAGFGVAKMVRVTGTISSIGFPRMAWTWTPARVPPPAAVPQLVPSVTAAANLADVPQFFGPNRDGIVTGAKLARDWTTSRPKQLWRQPIGAGWSAFAVVGGRAYTQEQRGESEAVTCYDVLTGKLIWRQTHVARFAQWQGGEGPRATPTVDRGLVFAYGATGVLECLEAATGRRGWSREVLKENHLANLEWGVSASPLVYEETVVVTGGNTKGATVLAFRRSTGEPLWRSGVNRASYSSPVLTTLAGRRLVLSFDAAALTAYDPATGERLLNHMWASERTARAAQPVVLPGDRVFLSAGYGVGCVLFQIKAATGNQLEATQLWKNMRMKNQFNSVAARDGFLYGLDDGLLACVDVESGERKWKEGRYGSGQTLLVDDLVIIQTESGPVVLAEAKPDGVRELGRIDALSSKTWNHPTLAGRYLLVRNDQEAAGYELPVEADAVGLAAGAK